MFIDVSKIDSDALYQILISTVVPRPIAWVSTVGASGIDNVAPFSFFNVVSANPPMLAFSVGLKEDPTDETKGVEKDTLRNIRQTPEFVVNIVSQPVAEKMNQSSGEYAADVSEFDAVGLTRAPASFVSVPRVAESLVNIECRLHSITSFGTKPGAGNLVVGQILCIHINDEVLKDGRVELDLLQPVGRLAGSWYTTVKDRFKMVRPKIDGD